MSNSSSSSFLVIFPKVPKSAEDVKNMLFDKDQTIYSGNYGGDYSVSQVAETVWYDICNQKVNDINAATEEFEGYDSVGSPEYEDFKHLPKDDIWDAYSNALKIYAKEEMKKFFNLRKLKLKKINKESTDETGALYIFEYSDQDGTYGSALEHGDLFHKLKYIRISKH